MNGAGWWGLEGGGGGVERIEGRNGDQQRDRCTERDREKGDGRRGGGGVGGRGRVKVTINYDTVAFF